MLDGWARTKPSRLNLATLHRDVKEMDAYVKLQLEDLVKQRRQLFEDFKRAQDLRCLTSLRATCIFPSIFNIEALARLPFVVSDTLPVYDRIIEIPGIAPLRGHLGKFLQNLYKLGPKLPSFYASLPMAAMTDSLEIPFLLPGIKPREFFAASALPSLFGFCWCSEMKISYFTFLMNVIRETPGFDLTLFGAHWVSECFKAYVFTTDIGDFLRASVGPILFEISRAAQFDLDGPTQTFKGTAVQYLKRMLANFRANIALIPKDVRLLIRMFAELAPSDGQRVLYAEAFFVECILSNAMLNPKAFGALPVTYQVPENSHFSILAGLWSLVMHPSSDSQFGYSTELHDLDLAGFLIELITVDSNLPGPSAVSWMAVTGAHHLFMLFSIPDVCLLAYFTTFVQNLPEAVVLACKNLMNNARDPDFRLFRYECWDFELYSFTKPEICNTTPELPPENAKLTRAAAVLYKFLGVAPKMLDEPPQLADFLLFQRECARLEHGFRSQSVLGDLEKEIAHLDEAELTALISATKDKFEQTRSTVAQNDALLTEISSLSEAFVGVCAACEQKMEDSRSVLNSQQLLLFLSKNPDVVQGFLPERTRFCRQRTSFRDYFLSTAQRLDEFLKGASSGLVRHLHTQMMQFLSLSDFIREHPRFVARDQQLTWVGAQKAFEICGYSRGPQKLALFQPAMDLLRRAFELELPLEAAVFVVRFVRCVRALLRELEEPMDQLRSAVAYAIVSSEIRCLFSFSRYLEFFLLDLGLITECEWADMRLFLEAIAWVIGQIPEQRASGRSRSGTESPRKAGEGSPLRASRSDGARDWSARDL
jgi:hypothetical protein